MTRLRLGGLAAAAALVTAAAAGCAPSNPDAGGGAGTASADRIVIGTTADVVNYNPLVGNSRTDTWVTNLMYPRLMGMDMDGKRTPYLATKWEYTDGGTTAKVTFTWTDDGLQVLVEDDGIRAEAIRNGLDPYVEAQKQGYTIDDDLAALTNAPSGRGITEMRERTELFGGVFEARPVPGVGFTVQAVFPSIRHHNGVHGVPLDRR